MTFLLRIMLASICAASINVAWADNYSDGLAQMNRQRYEEAFSFFEKAAGEGRAEAKFYLGSLYASGKGVKQNQALAVMWYQKAAEQGDAKAQYMMGHAYEFGKGISQNYRQALFWYQKAADKGLAVAQYNLGLMYADDSRDIRQDLTKARYWFQKAADQGHAKAYWDLKKLDKVLSAHSLLHEHIG